MRGQSKPQKTFYFVDVNPSSEIRPQTRKRIRSHVGKWAWYEMGKNGSEGLSEADTPSSSNTPSAAALASSTPEPVGGAGAEDDHVRPEEPEDADLKLERDEGQEILVPTHSRGWTGSDPYQRGGIGSPSLLGGSFDPFESYPSSLPESLVAKCVHYSTSILWPGLIPGFSSGPRAGAFGWFDMLMGDAAVFTAEMFGVISHRKMYDYAHERLDLTRRRVENREALLLENKTIQGLNEALQDPSGISDGIIVAVQCLSVSRFDESILKWKAKSPFHPPLTKLQWINIYGALTIDPIHASGLEKMINLRGGLDNVRLPGFTAILTYSKTLHATRTLTKPPVPFYPLSPTTPIPPTLPTVLNYTPADFHHGFGPFITTLNFPPPLAETYQAMLSYQSIVSTYLDGAVTNPITATMIDQRNIVQYTLLSLPGSDEMDASFRARHPVYETARLAALTYNIGVLFPLPPMTAPFERLVPLLKSALEQALTSVNWAASVRATQLLLWVLVVGGIAAMGMGERGWFVGVLRRVVRQVGVVGWEGLKGWVGGIMWLECACDPGGKDLWREVEGGEGEGGGEGLSNLYGLVG
ncbi:hypothetical protein FQN53_002449 [Emmonsiellopsis sp. PD_33]|nr:hypothetical protein FQN53_002449 [Emmonsiellopsis sp. PD_33]